MKAVEMCASLFKAFEQGSFVTVRQMCSAMASGLIKALSPQEAE